MCIGKWHVGDQPEFLPTRQGFDHYFGIPYSNDMQRKSTETGRARGAAGARRQGGRTAHRRGSRAASSSATPTRRSVSSARTRTSRSCSTCRTPPCTRRSIPARRFAGKSANGRFGDWVEEVDWSVGRVLDTLRELKLDGTHARHLHQRQRPVAHQGRRRRQRRAVARRQGQHLGRRRARADARVVAGQDRAGQRVRRRRGHHRPAAHRRRARRRHGAGRAGDRRPRHLAAAVRQDASSRRARRTTTSPATTSRPCARARGNSPSPRSPRRWAKALPATPAAKRRASTTSTQEIGEQTNLAAKHPEIVARSSRRSPTKMNAEIGGKAPDGAPAGRRGGESADALPDGRQQATRRSKPQEVRQSRLRLDTLKPGDSVDSAAAPRKSPAKPSPSPARSRPRSATRSCSPTAA